MARWDPDSRGRLEEAALALYAERGYEQTTVAEIARRAGLTERTFFRHYADKREVLFASGEEMERRIVDAVAAAPAGATPIEAAAAGLEAAAAMLEGRPEQVRRRHAVISASAELRERELMKLAGYAAALTGVLRARGVEDTAARLAAEVALAVLRTAIERWIAEGEERGTLRDAVRHSLAALGAVVAPA